MKETNENTTMNKMEYNTVDYCKVLYYTSYKSSKNKIQIVNEILKTKTKTRLRTVSNIKLCVGLIVVYSLPVSVEGSLRRGLL